MSKILFICKGNNCRSQIAEAVYNRLTNSHDASSAGTRVDGDSETLEQFNNRPEVSSYTLDDMRDAGYDLKNKRQNQLTQEMIKQYDLIISMAAKRYTPQWLAAAPNYTYWKITDPKGRSYAVTKHAKDEVEQRVRELITALSSQAGIDGLLHFLHYYDPQNENDRTARTFMDFLVKHSSTLATGGDDVLKELYEQFKKQVTK